MKTAQQLLSLISDSSKKTEEIIATFKGIQKATQTAALKYFELKHHFSLPGNQTTSKKDLQSIQRSHKDKIYDIGNPLSWYYAELESEFCSNQSNTTEAAYLDGESERASFNVILKAVVARQDSKLLEFLLTLPIFRQTIRKVPSYDQPSCGFKLLKEAMQKNHLMGQVGRNQEASQNVVNCLLNDKEIAEEVNTHYLQILSTASATNNIDVVKSVLARPTIQQAMASPHTMFVSFNSSNAIEEDPFRSAAFYDQPEILASLYNTPKYRKLDAYSLGNALSETAKGPSFKAMKFLLSTPATQSPYAYELDLLRTAAIHGEYDIVDRLLNIASDQINQQKRPVKVDAVVLTPEIIQKPEYAGKRAEIEQILKEVNDKINNLVRPSFVWKPDVIQKQDQADKILSYAFHAQQYRVLDRLLQFYAEHNLKLPTQIEQNPFRSNQGFIDIDYSNIKSMIEKRSVNPSYEVFKDCKDFQSFRAMFAKHSKESADSNASGPSGAQGVGASAAAAAGAGATEAGAGCGAMPSQVAVVKPVAFSPAAGAAAAAAGPDPSHKLKECEAANSSTTKP